EEICDELLEHIYQTAGCFSPYLVIEVPAIAGCRDTAYIEPCINIQSNGSVSQNDLHTHFKVYPNPTTNWLTIESETLQIKTIRIIDITGKELLNIENFDNEKVDISNLNSGCYRIIIYSDGGEHNLPLIKL
ncbi:MAG: T9SS type A sorting domain-containing protein, partial [Bacteroidales bacterium]|nr:T9SS type A sorting domain-containing protein [Bacteroidales bacterium]